MSNNRSLAELLYGNLPPPKSTLLDSLQSSRSSALAALLYPSAIPPAPRSPLDTLLARRVASKSMHDRLVDRLARHLGSLSHYAIAADAQGWPSKPTRIIWRATDEGHVPDVTSQSSDGQLQVFEVETEDTISIEHTRLQCKLFATHAAENRGRFYMVVPRGMEIKAQRQLDSWGFGGGAFWV